MVPRLCFVRLAMIRSLQLRAALAIAALFAIGAAHAGALTIQPPVNFGNPGASSPAELIARMS